MEFERRSTVIHSSLLEVKSTAGAEFIPVLINFTVTAMLFMGPHIVWWPAVAWVIHKVLQYLFTVDQRMFEVLWKYLSEGDYYDPWPRYDSRVKRPYGMGRDLPLC
jgi:type IV secretory pathway VirB3-like protein